MLHHTAGYLGKAIAVVVQDLLSSMGMQTAPQAIATTTEAAPKLSGLVFELLIRSVTIALLGAGVILATLAFA